MPTLHLALFALLTLSAQATWSASNNPLSLSNCGYSELASGARNIVIGGQKAKRINRHTGKAAFARLLEIFPEGNYPMQGDHSGDLLVIRYLDSNGQSMKLPLWFRSAGGIGNIKFAIGPRTNLTESVLYSGDNGHVVDSDLNGISAHKSFLISSPSGSDWQEAAKQHLFKNDYVRLGVSEYQLVDGQRLFHIQQAKYPRGTDLDEPTVLSAYLLLSADGTWSEFRGIGNHMTYDEQAWPMSEVVEFGGDVGGSLNTTQPPLIEDKAKQSPVIENTPDP